jgi:AraC family transcriptional regulator
MPEHAGALLRGGEFYSPVKSALRTEDVLLSELHQHCSRIVPRHEHELAYITLLLHGDYLEGDRGKLEVLSPFTAVFNPSGARHATVIGPAGASLFTIELREQHLRHLSARLPLQTEFDRGIGSLLWPAIRLYSAFKTQTADALVLESHVLELLGALEGASASQEKSAPRWLERVKERMHLEFRENIRMRDLAEDAGVHPVHLARVFRAQAGRTPGDYLQQVRVRAACHRLCYPAYPLSAIAVECGFADQSHFTRVFKKLTESTPAQFRSAITC